MIHKKREVQNEIVTQKIHTFRGKKDRTAKGITLSIPEMLSKFHVKKPWK